MARGGSGRASERRPGIACCIRLEVASFSCCLDHAPPLQCFPPHFSPSLPSKAPPPASKLLLHWRELGPLRSPFCSSCRREGGVGFGPPSWWWWWCWGLRGEWRPQRAPASPQLQLLGCRAAALHGPIIAAAPEFGRSVLSPITTAAAAAAAAALEFGCRCPTSL